VEQLAFADRIILNKMDLVKGEEDKAEVLRRIRAINAVAPVRETVCAEVDLDWLLGIRAFDLKRILVAEPDFLQVRERVHLELLNQ
jgi:G3E family GTPase